jgi:hypothetical protein
MLFNDITYIQILSNKQINIRMHKTTSCLMVLYGCETSSLTLMEEHRLRVFENRSARENIWT